MSTSIMIKAPSVYEDQHLGKINEAKKPFTWNMTNVPLLLHPFFKQEWFPAVCSRLQCGISEPGGEHFDHTLVDIHAHDQ